MMVWSKALGAAALAAAPVFFLGCGSVLRQPANVEATREDVVAIRREQTELMALVLELRTRLESQSEIVSALRADSNLELRQLTGRLDVLVARIEDLGARSDRTRREPPAAPAPAPGDTARSGGGAGPGGSVGKDAQASFDAAKRDFSRGNYQLAVAGFDEAQAADSGSDLADDAQYWKGEAYYSLGQVDRAIQELLRVRDVYPDGNMVAAATFKLGIAFLRKEDSATARRWFETVVREYPGTSEASLAQDKLKSLH